MSAAEKKKTGSGEHEFVAQYQNTSASIRNETLPLIQQLNERIRSSEVRRKLRARDRESAPDSLPSSSSRNGRPAAT